jgi:membrane-bound lytic murein transglycosylase B
MSDKRLTTWQKATALVPLALLSGAWTTSLATTTSASASPEDRRSTTLPDGTTVPDRAIEAPASMTRPGSIAPGVPEGTAEQVARDASPTGIPAAALAAYQRAEQVINAADKSCNLPWQLVAAIGRVESDHGRYGGNVLGEDGQSRPGIYGIPLDGSDGTAEINDTDAGDLDNDPVYDRAVGPMQFIPSTWSVVGVDADGDGTRDPQNINDAALASAVYLCSGDEDLSTYGGQKAAVYRYNHSEEYVDLVISIMNAYLDGDYSSVPNGVTTTPVLAPAPGSLDIRLGNRGAGPDNKRDGGKAKARGDRKGTQQRGGGSGSGGTSGGTSGGGGDSSSTPGGGSTDQATDPVQDTVEKTTDTVRDTTKKVTDGVKDTTGKVGDTLDDATGGATDEITDGLEDTTGQVTDGLNDTVGGLTGGLG